MPEAAIMFEDLTLGYNSHPAVHHLSGDVRRGALLAVVGANGSGKSTLMKGIAGLLKPMAGSVAVAGGTRIAYLPQSSELDRSFPARVCDVVSLGLWPRRGLLARHTPEDRARVAQAIRAVGLSGFEERGLDTLSGGQLQRALFARVIVQDAGLILLDEPFNAVDRQTIADLLGIVAGWHRDGRTVLAVAHDLDLVRAHFPQTLLLARRAVAWGPTRDALGSDTLERARRFDEAWHDDAPWCADDHAPPHAPDHEHGSHGHAGHSHGPHAHGHHDREQARTG